MKRRSILKSGIYLTGYSFLLGGTASVLHSCRNEKSPDGWTPEVLTQEEVELVAEIAETIIPKTDTPGAKDAGVHRFIDENIRLNLNPVQQNDFKQGLLYFEEKAMELYDKSFTKLASEEKIEVLKTMEKEASSIPEDDPTHIITALDDMVKFGYFTSEVGSKEFLIFDPVPGAYVGCIDLSEVGGTWAIVR